MERYGDRGGKSGILEYELGTDFIRVRFAGDRTYRYSHARAGQIHVERMKRLAREGRGLGTYISKYAYDLFDRED